MLFLFPHDIVTMGKNQDQDNLGESEEEDVPTDFLSHADTASAFELALRYVEPHAAATPTDMRRFQFGCFPLYGCKFEKQNLSKTIQNF
ncbi:hypothetical protein AVEN_183048-1 [Araneus ventricosus]|uniref:Uncharacterized protein n=1 Tax=Araneus ventricosus TaxID=182803 RepID=A0A4Y2F0Z3_ARAVE|nr:hypothetical protein AVEN_183048-1 [Araneus ventricosus]